MSGVAGSPPGHGGRAALPALATDLTRFLGEREPGWKELEIRLDEIEGRGLAGLPRADVRRVVALYRQASSDLIEARASHPNADLVAYLNGLVARSYAALYAAPDFDWRGVLAFFARGFPALARRRAPYVLAAALLYAAGGLVGGLGVTLDPAAREWLVPEDHRDVDPAERVALDEAGNEATASRAAAFSSFLFTHNIRVAFVAFALGITLGIGTVAVLFSNGVLLGALAADYHLAGEGLFFWAWILPHGVPEIYAIFVAGAAGLILGKSLLVPGDRTLRESFASEGTDAVLLVLGTMPVLVVAGLVEGSLSQIHEPRLPYAVKLAFASALALALAAWLRLAGRPPSDPART